MDDKIQVEVKEQTPMNDPTPSEIIKKLPASELNKEHSTNK